MEPIMTSSTGTTPVQKQDQEQVPPIAEMENKKAERVGAGAGVGTGTGTKKKNQSHHLFVLMHGLWGGPGHLSTVRDCLNDMFDNDPSTKVHTLVPKNYAYFKTYDGIKNCGNSVIDDIFKEIISLHSKGISLDQISFIGYSFGGLIARYCIGELYKINGFFDHIKPCFFTTFATPHLGVKFFDNSIFHNVLNNLGTHLLGRAGRELFIADNDKILCQLADPQGPYYKGLASFQKRFLLANIRNDRTVPFYTAFITNYQPFANWDGIVLKYLDHVPEVEIGANKIRCRVVDLHKSTRIECQPTKSYSSDKVLRYLIILMLVCFVLPLWLPIVTVASCFGTVQSFIRNLFTPNYDVLLNWQNASEKLKLPEVLQKDSNGEEVVEGGQHKNRSRRHPIEGEFAELTEDYIEGVLAAEDRFHGRSSSGSGSSSDQKQEESSDASEETTTTPAGSKSQTKFSQFVKYNPDKMMEFVNANMMIFDESYYIDIKEANPQTYPLLKEDSPEVVLKFDQDRLQILEDLNSLPFIKLPIYVDSFNAHDGIISRRGIRTSPKGTASIILWATILKSFIQQNTTDN